MDGASSPNAQLFGRWKPIDVDIPRTNRAFQRAAPEEFSETAHRVPRQLASRPAILPQHAPSLSHRITEQAWPPSRREIFNAELVNDIFDTCYASLAVPAISSAASRDVVPLRT